MTPAARMTAAPRDTENDFVGAQWQTQEEITVKPTDMMRYSAEEPLTIHRDEVGITADAQVPPLYFFVVSEHSYQDAVVIDDKRLAFMYDVTPKTVMRWRRMLVKYGYIAATRLDGGQYAYRLLRMGNF